MTVPSEALCSAAIFLAALLSAAAGLGGGGMFMPLLLSLSGMSASKAVPTSQAIIVSGAVINLGVFLSARHPEAHDHPVIDYDGVALMMPMLSLGAMVGVLVNRVSPLWLLIALLVIALSVALWRTGSKAANLYQLESATADVAAPSVSAPPASAGGPPLAKEEGSARSCPGVLLPRDALHLMGKKAWQVLAILGIWVAVLGVSFHGLDPCSWSFAGLLTTTAAFLLLCTLAVAARLERARGAARSEDAPVKAPFDWMSHGKLHYPALAGLAGLVAAMLGIGGGMILSPVLVEVRLHSQAVQATTVVFVFLCSSIATIQFAAFGQHEWDYVIWYAGLSAVATVAGQLFCELYIRKHKRYSLIAFAITGVILASLMLLVVVGVQRVVQDYRLGRQMWFSTSGLCHDDGSTGGSALLYTFRGGF